MFIAAITGFVIPRMLNVADFGRFAAALSFAQILAIIVDSGMGQLAAKDIAKGSSHGFSQLNQIFSWRLLVIAAACLLTVPLTRLLFSSPEVRWMAFWLTVGMFFITMTDLFCWIFKGTQQIDWCAGLQITGKSLLLVLCLLALTSAQPISRLLLAYVMAGITMTVLGLYILFRAVHVVRPVKLTPSFFSDTLPNIYKVGGIVILSVMFTRLDMMLVAKYCGDFQSGLYASAVRLIDAARLIPTVILGIYLPVFSAHAHQADALRLKFRRAFGFLFICSTLIALVGSSYAEPLFINVLGSQYRASALYFKPLVWSCVFMFPNMVMFALLYALNDHQTPTLGIVAALGLNVVLNVLFLPRYGPIAAAWARLIGDFFSFAFQARGVLCRHILPVNNLLIRPGLVVGTCAAVLLLLDGHSARFQLLSTVGTFCLLTLILRHDRPWAERA